MSEAPLYEAFSLSISSAACERRSSNLKDVKAFHLEAKTQIWSSLPYLCGVRSTAAKPHGFSEYL